MTGGDGLYEAYVAAVIRTMESFCKEELDTVYFGGGTPPLLGAERLDRMLAAARKCFDIAPDAEITVEINPGDATAALLSALYAAGFNRLSMGVQSGVDSELRALGRRHDSAQAAGAVELARAAGFENISLDLMLAIPHQTPDSLRQSIDFITGLEPEHISAYMLKIEENTPFAAISDKLILPDDDGQAELYLEAVKMLAERGYKQYEISNFSKQGRESRHNLKYWHCEEYIGIGPAAHGFYEGRRYYYPRDIEGFMQGNAPVDDGEGGSKEEYLMLMLRLAEGITESAWNERFGEPIPQCIRRRALMYQQAGLLVCDDNGIRLTTEGFLVSNGIIARLMDE